MDHPAHYTAHPSRIECIELLRGRESRLAHVISHLWRSRTKRANPRSETQEADWYLRDFLFAPIEALTSFDAGGTDGQEPRGCRVPLPRLVQ
ncbi:hypothetical protein [Corynebacterium sp. AOP12-C2-36]|uniref:hypothetical protein n=1 Tax=Corynebacterium sp. AOP12-C2-36 TaxID=3457723 RepID=UPI0040349799